MFRIFEDLKRRFDEMAERQERLVNKMDGMDHKIDGMSHEIKKVRLQNEVMWFSAPGMSFYSGTSNL
jgi:hypothetical protein